MFQVRSTHESADSFQQTGLPSSDSQRNTNVSLRMVTVVFRNQSPVHECFVLDNLYCDTYYCFVI